MSKSTNGGGSFAASTSSPSSFCLKTLLPLLALAYLLLLAEEFPTFNNNANSVARATNTRGYSDERNILCDVGVPEFLVFVDAGSTGCRAHTFRVNYSANDEGEGEEGMRSSGSDDKTRLFSLTTVGKKVKSLHPLASLRGKSEKDIETALLPMLEGAMRKIEAIEEEEKTNGKRKRKRRRSPITTSFGKGEQSEGKSRVPLCTSGRRPGCGF